MKLYGKLAVSRICWRTNLTKKIFFFVVGSFFWERPPTLSIRPDIASTASAVEFYIILHKILTETVY